MAKNNRAGDIIAASLLDYRLVRVDTLKPDPNNARTHSAEQVAELARSIRKFGFTAPLIALADGSIVAGHGRLQAAKSLGLSEVPVLVAPGDWTEQDVRAYMLADNQLALRAAWDEDLLRSELLALTQGGYDVGVAGFDPDTLDAIINGWAADFDKLEAIAHDEGGIPGVVKVRCLASQMGEVEARVRVALEGMQGVEISSQA